MKKMGKKSGAVGFAVYADLLEAFEQPEPNMTLICLLFTVKIRQKRAYKTIKSAVNDGKTVSAQKNVPERLKYKEKIEL